MKEDWNDWIAEFGKLPLDKKIQALKNCTSFTSFNSSFWDEVDLNEVFKNCKLDENDTTTNR